MNVAALTIRGSGRVLAGACALWVSFACGALRAEGFSPSRTPTVTAARVKNMGCHYFTELLGVYSAATLARQFDPLANTEVDTVVCCPSSWRFYNFPSKVDLTWREPDKHPRKLTAYANWRKMVDNLQAGGDPLRDALAATRALRKSFIVSFRMNDSHYVTDEEFPTHNNFWRDHPAWRLGNDVRSYAVSDTTRMFDYLIPEVRDFYFAVLEEICTTYDVDGVELDFQRAPRFFHDRELAQGRAVMTAHVQRIRRMLDQVGAKRGKHLRLGVRALHTVEANFKVGADILAWDAAGLLDDVVVSPSYIQTADVGIEGFAAGLGKARIFGELNFVHLQLAGTGHNPQERRYVTAQTYRAATLSYLERGAGGVSFFNTYCIPQPALATLNTALLARFKDLDLLQRADKNYSSYPTTSTMFGRIFPARDEKVFQVFVADQIPGFCRSATLRFETKAACANLPVEVRVNGISVDEYHADQIELFPPLAVNAAAPRKENLKFFSVPLGALKFGVNLIEVRNREAPRLHCDFVSAELGLYLGK